MEWRGVKSEASWLEDLLIEAVLLTDANECFAETPLMSEKEPIMLSQQVSTSVKKVNAYSSHS